MHVDRIEDGEEGEAPGDAVDDDALAGGEELVDDGAEEEEVDEGPDKEGPGRGRQVRLLPGVVDVGGGGDGVDVGAEEEEVGDDVDNLEDEAGGGGVVGHGGCLRWLIG